MIFLNCDLLIPESGIGCHSGGGVPLETPSDEVGEQRVLAPCNILRTDIVPRHILRTNIVSTNILRTNNGPCIWYTFFSFFCILLWWSWWWFYLWGQSVVPVSLVVPLAFPSATCHTTYCYSYFFNFASPLLWTFGFPTCLYSNNMRNIVNITANNILDCVAPAPVENCGTIWEGGRRAVPWVTCNRIHFI